MTDIRIVSSGTWFQCRICPLELRSISLIAEGKSEIEPLAVVTRTVEWAGGSGSNAENATWLRPTAGPAAGPAGIAAQVSISRPVRHARMPGRNAKRETSPG